MDEITCPGCGARVAEVYPDTTGYEHVLFQCGWNGTRARDNGQFAHTGQVKISPPMDVTDESLRVHRWGAYAEGEPNYMSEKIQPELGRGGGVMDTSPKVRVYIDGRLIPVVSLHSAGRDRITVRAITGDPNDVDVFRRMTRFVERPHGRECVAVSAEFPYDRVWVELEEE